MPKIRTYTPGAQPGITPTPFGQGSRSGLQELGRTVQATGQQVGQALERHKAQQENEKASFNAARIAEGTGTGMQHFLHAMENDQDGYLRRQGKAALEGRDGALATLDAIQQEQIDAVDDPTVKAAISARLEKAKLGYQEQIYAHAAKQGQVVKDRAFAVDQEGWSTAAKNAQTDAQRDYAVGQIGESAMAHARANEVTDFQELSTIDRQARGEANRAIIIDLAKSNPDKAFDYMAKPDVANTLDKTFLDDQTQVAAANLRTSISQAEAQDIAEGAVDSRGYIDTGLAQDMLANLDFEGDEETRKATAAELQKHIKESELRKGSDVYQAYGRGAQAIQEAIDRGDSDPLSAVDEQDKRFLFAMGGDGNEHWVKLKRMAAMRGANKKAQAAGGRGRFRGQARMAVKAEQEMREHPDWYRDGVKGKLANGEEVELRGPDLLFAKWGNLLSPKDEKRLGRLAIGVTAGEVSKDTSKETLNMFEDQARARGRLAPTSRQDTPEQVDLYAAAQATFTKKEEEYRKAHRAEPPPEVRNKWVVDELLKTARPPSPRSGRMSGIRSSGTCRCPPWT